MPLKLTILEDLGGDASVETAAAAPFGVGVEFKPSTDRADMLKAAAHADAILVRLAQIDADFMDAVPSLRVIGRSGVGTDNIDVNAATERGIQVVYVPDYCVEEVATHAVALMLTAWRRVPTALGLGAQGQWFEWDEVSPIRPLSSCSLGIVGMGRIGRTFFEMAGPWFKEVRYHDPFATEAPAGTTSVGLDELFETSDIISLHCPSTPSTRELVNRDRLALLGSDALIVNVSRGDLVDESALLDGLAGGKPSRVALDVLATEPPPKDDPLLHHPAVTVTNHMAWLSTDSLDRVRSLLARRCALALVGQDAETVVNARELGLLE